MTVFRRPRLWKLTAGASALVLCGLLIVSAQGSLSIVATRGAVIPASSSWIGWCSKGHPRQDRKRLAFCARVQGRVLSSTHGPDAGESHIAVIGDFHLLIVRMPDYAPTPAIGARVTAIGPLFRARNGQREVQAFRFSKP